MKDTIAASVVGQTFQGHVNADKDQDGKVSLAEYKAAFASDGADTEKTIALHEEDFRKSDTNRDGHHSIKEAEEDAEERAMTLAKQYMEKGDTDKDGKLSFDEYQQLHLEM